MHKTEQKNKQLHQKRKNNIWLLDKSVISLQELL